MTCSPKSTAALIRKQIAARPALAMVLGSGFQHALVYLEQPRELAYGELPGFPRVGVSGHAGKLVFGYFDKVPVVVLKGRAHYYEGHEMERVTFPVRVMAELGVGSILLTNAAGGINRSFSPGDFMALTDHINFMGANPLRGPAQPGLPRFVDLSRVYDPALIELAKKAAKQSRIKLRQGVYLAVSGPNYETPAEIRAFRSLGADAVGMSTVPEAIVARQCGLPVAGISCITNIAGGDPKGGALLHQDVLATGEKKKDAMAQFLKTFAILAGSKKSAAA
ncbi:MAG TPA: purine-nucleoside phosphorylase [Verrucomicrobiae bacterium]|jgi:purine-nucleoside phosphorylase|nr:purine-nucleoside phosphorylase [Verrucomicrobiae bacterium]